MTILKPLGAAGALVAAALVGGTLIGSTLAVDEETDTDAGDITSYCETFRDTLANELGVSVDEMTAAGRAAADATLDAAVAAGDLDADRAETLRQRIAAFDGTCDGLGPFARGFGMGFDRGLDRGLGNGPAGAGGLQVGALQAAADALGLDAVDLREQLADGASLQEIAGDAWDDVKASVLTDVQARLDEAVAEGLDQERADTILEHITTWLDGGGQLDEMGGPAGGMGPGQGRGHGPSGRGGGMGIGPGGFWGTDDAE
jgi:hypothetical protein